MITLAWWHRCGNISVVALAWRDQLGSIGLVALFGGIGFVALFGGIGLVALFNALHRWRRSDVSVSVPEPLFLVASRCM